MRDGENCAGTAVGDPVSIVSALGLARVTVEWINAGPISSRSIVRFDGEDRRAFIFSGMIRDLVPADSSDNALYSELDWR